MWRRHMNDLWVVVGSVRRSRRGIALRILALIEADVAARRFDHALILGELLLAQMEADDRNRHAHIYRGLLVLRLVWWSALLGAAATGVLIASG
jgi:hypothetical protein